jgi:hypothetical protein
MMSQVFVSVIETVYAKIVFFSLVTERHQGRVINFEYMPLQRAAIQKTVMLVGKVRRKSHPYQDY